MIRCCLPSLAVSERPSESHTPARPTLLLEVGTLPVTILSPHLIYSLQTRMKSTLVLPWGHRILDYRAASLFSRLASSCDNIFDREHLLTGHF